MKFDFHVHGLWILGSATLFIAGLIAGNLEWVEGITPVSFVLALLLSFMLFLLAGTLWISSAVNVED